MRIPPRFQGSSVPIIITAMRLLFAFLSGDESKKPGLTSKAKLAPNRSIIGGSVYKQQENH